MNGEELRRRRLLLGYSIHGLAEILRAQPVSVEAWESGEAPIPPEVEEALALLEDRGTNGACDLVIL
jgi:transcriptional regulator with XRE-family HTH domain